uniref:CBS domain-containing protein n=1 Tax=Oryza meridionalis TaxID=40149 RepID=A0A0E0ESH0_9ORYZ
MMLLRPRFLSPSPISSSSSSSSPSPRRSPPPSSSTPRPRARHRRRRRAPSSPPPTQPELRRLTSRIVDLTRRRQLPQIMDEVGAARRRAVDRGAGGGLNTIVMNAVLEACVRCGDVGLALTLFDEMRGPGGCGVDGVSYGILLKGLGIARRIDDAFEILESIEKDTSIGSPRLSPHLICGFLNALIEAGDMRRANALVARFRQVLYEGHSILLYNLLMKGYIKSNFPLGALTVKDEILRQGLKPDRLTYNTIISACVKSAEIDMAIQFLEDMKEEAKRDNNPELLPDAVTYTTLLKPIRGHVGAGKQQANLLLPAALRMNRALCIFGEIIKQAGNNKDLRPKPHLYLSIMRAFATIGDLDMVKRLNKRMWPDSVGSISRSAKEEADELLMEAALNNNQIDMARGLLRRIVNEKECFSWTSRVGMVAVKVETLSGFTNSLLRPHVFPQIVLNDPVEKYMIPFQETQPLHADLILEEVVMRFFKDPVVPIVDDWGSCVGIVHRQDCTKIDAPLLSMSRGPPLCVPTSTSVEHVIDLLLREKSKMVVVVKRGNMYEGSYASSSRPLGVFSLAILWKFTADATDIDGMDAAHQLQQDVEASNCG